MSEIREMAMEAIKRRLKESTVRNNKLVDFDSSGYGPGAVVRLWDLVDQLTRHNRLMRLHINGVRGLTKEDLKWVRFYLPADKKLEGIDDRDLDRMVSTDIHHAQEIKREGMEGL